MGIASLTVGQNVQLEGNAYLLTRILDSDRIELERRDNRCRSEIGRAELLGLYTSGRAVFAAEASPTSLDPARRKVWNSTMLGMIPTERREKAVLRLHFVKALEGIPLSCSTLDGLIQNIWQRLRPAERTLMPSCPGTSTVCRWIKRWRESDHDICSLVDGHGRKGNRECRLDPAVVQIVDDAINTVYLRPERPTLTDLLTHINDRIALHNVALIPSEQLPVVGQSYVRRRLQDIPAYDRDVARYGRRVADVKFRVSGQGVPAVRPLARASMDHCQLDFFVVDEATRLPLGRPWLTVILDECTRMVLGYSLSFDDPSAMSTMRALRHALLPKDLQAGIQNEWPTWGIMEVLVVDNGTEFHGTSLSYCAAQFGITVQTCPRRKPWYKGKVERFFRTVHTGLAPQIPGRTFSNVVSRDEYNSEKHAVISLDTLLIVIERWISDVYHQTVHAALSETPSQCWNRLIADVPRYLPESAQWADAAFGKPDRRVLGHQGVEYDSLFYNSDDAGALRRLHGDRETFDIIVNDEDVGYIYVVDPTGSAPVRIPAVDLDYAAGLTRWQHRKCKEYARHLASTSGNAVGLAQARMEIAKLIQRDIKFRPHKASKSGWRFMHENNPSLPVESKREYAIDPSREQPFHGVSLDLSDKRASNSTTPETSVQIYPVRAPTHISGRNAP
jgi:putative transposase